MCVGWVLNQRMKLSNLIMVPKNMDNGSLKINLLPYEWMYLQRTMSCLMKRILTGVSWTLFSINAFAMDCDMRGCREDIEDIDASTHGNPLDFIVPFLIGVFLVLFIWLSAAAAVKYWKENKYLTFIIFATICIALSWFLLSWIDWRWFAAVGLMGSVWVAIGAAFLLFGFVLKLITGIFLKDVRNMSTNNFVESIAALVGGVMSTMFIVALYAFMFVGIPIVLIINVFGLG